jgi:phosphoribosylformimino-5-aminoimidazole carboxamide ribotide isomerase
VRWAGQISHNSPCAKQSGHLSLSAGDYAGMYRERNLEGGHVIKLGPRNDEAAKEALQAWPGEAHISSTMYGSKAELYERWPSDWWWH